MGTTHTTTKASQRGKQGRFSKVSRFVRRQPHVIQAGMVVLAFAIVGFGLAAASHAATFASDGELEVGGLTGNAFLLNDDTASAGLAVNFDGSNAPTAPANLKAFSGGGSIAVRWDPSAVGNMANSAATIKQYVIYRNGNKIGSVDPTKLNTNFPEVNNCGYLDTTAQPATSYQYTIQAVDTAGKVSPLSDALSTSMPVSDQSVPTFSLDVGTNTDLTPYLTNTVLPFLKTWYPKVADQIAYPDYSAPTAVTLKLDSAYTGVAFATSSTRTITFNPAYLRKNPNDLGQWLFQAVYVIQDHKDDSVNGTNNWALTGMAEWARDYMLQDRYPSATVPGGLPYTNGNTQGAFFYNYIASTYDKNIIRKVNVAGHNLQYSDQLFVTSTGKTLPQLQSDMVANTYAKGYGGPVYFSKYDNGTTRCLDNAKLGSDSFYAATMNSCVTATPPASQTWSIYNYTDGSKLLQDGNGRCLDNYGLSYYPQGGACDGLPGNFWLQRSDGTLESKLNPGYCLTYSNPFAVNLTYMQLTACDGRDTQIFSKL